MRAFRMACAGLVLAAVAPSAFAAERTLAVRDVHVIEDGRGAARVLFRVGDVPSLDREAVLRATLRVPYAGAAEGRRMELRVSAVTTAWDAGRGWSGGWRTPGGDVDPELSARASADLSGSGGVAVFDLTSAFREIHEEGTFADGFLLTERHPSREGLATEDVGRLDFSRAVLELQTQTVLRRPPPGHPAR